MTHSRGAILRRTQSEQGFTLIELLVVVAIIAVLAAVASQAFAGYRSHGYDALACSDLHTVATAEEAYFTFARSYLPCATAAACAASLPSYVPSAGVVLNIAATDNSFVGNAHHPAGTRIWTFESEVGRFVFQVAN